jgi:hypothetical protein
MGTPTTSAMEESETGRMQLPRRRAVALMASLAIVATAAALPGASVWQPFMMLVAPAWAAWMVRRISMVATIYLAQTSAYYGGTWLILRPERPPQLVSIVVLWSAGLMVGCILGQRRRASAARRAWQPPTGMQFVLASASVGSYLLLVASGRLGYQAQLTTGSSTPTGSLGTLATAAPVITMLVLITALSSGRRVIAATLLAVVAVIVLSLSGFRGAGVSLIAAVAYFAALMLPRESPWRRPRRLLIMVPVLLIFLATAFSVGAQVKSAVATNLQVASQGSQLFGLNKAANAIATRVDESDPLQQAITYRNDHNVRQAVSWTKQLEAGVPRFLWPGKPVGDYGQSVSETVYGLRQGRSSGYLTVIGDTLVNFGTVGLVLGALLFGYVLTVLESRIRAGTTTLSLVLAATLAYTVLTVQVTLIFTAVAVVRTFLVTAVLWGLAEVIGGGRRAKRSR